MPTIAGVKLADMAKKPKASLSPKNTGKLSPDPYSFEHRISLDQDAMDKLGMNELPKVGDKLQVMGHGEVHSVSQDADSFDGGKPRKRVGIQLKHMAVQPAPKAGGAKAAVDSGIDEANQS